MLNETILVHARSFQDFLNDFNIMQTAVVFIRTNFMYSHENQSDKEDNS